MSERAYHGKPHPGQLRLLVGLLGVASGQPGGQPPGDEKPFPRPEADGPTSFVTAAALSPDGKTLYVAGWDKVVHVWRLDETGKFALDRAATYRVPIGPGQGGSLNALALSTDGHWLAVAGFGLARGEMSFETHGIFLRRMPTDVLLDRGMIYVFNTQDPRRQAAARHEGQVLSLAFAPSAGGSAARCWSAPARNGTRIASVSSAACGSGTWTRAPTWPRCGNLPKSSGPAGLGGLARRAGPARRAWPGTTAASRLGRDRGRSPC